MHKQYCIFFICLVLAVFAYIIALATLMQNSPIMVVLMAVLYDAIIYAMFRFPPRYAQHIHLHDLQPVCDQHMLCLRILPVPLLSVFQHGNGCEGVHYHIVSVGGFSSVSMVSASVMISMLVVMA